MDYSDKIKHKFDIQIRTWCTHQNITNLKTKIDKGKKGPNNFI